MEEAENKKQSSGILGPRGRLFLETHPVGGRIPNDKLEEWKLFKSYCSVNGLKLSPDGMLDMLEVYNLVNSATARVAKECGLVPITFRDKMLKAFVKELAKIKTTELQIDTAKIQSNVSTNVRSAAQAATS